ncbi:unnamed protein product [Moneuplotes crassus]|uniref:Cytochrome P450 n=1 Tax=Euplotes crassus TaxID=5936 RepID=A0AAD1XBR8_EUPCR|nr:unnamed protein product [Moneuplotes crassus]
MLLTLLLISIVSLALYLFNKMIVMPTMYRTKYSKFSNVKMSSKATMFKGDAVEVKHNIDSGKHAFSHYIDLAVSEEHTDIYLKFEGPNPVFVMLSPRALGQTSKLMPSRIDRDDSLINQNFGKIFYNSLNQLKSDANWKLRRNTLMKAIGLSFAPTYIQKLLDCMNRVVVSWKPKTTVDFTNEFAAVETSFMTQALLGKGFDHSQFKFDYQTQSNRVIQITLHEVMARLRQECVSNVDNKLEVLLPFINDYNLCQPFRRIMTNVKHMSTKIQEFLQDSQDQESVYAKVKQETVCTDDELLADILCLLFQGIGSTSHVTALLMYYLNKHPQVMDKCKQVYEEHGITTNGVLQTHKLTTGDLENCEYADYVIKEALRLNTSVSKTAAYRTLEDVVICGVPIKKDNWITLENIGCLLDLKHWHEPLEFIPERFDPESEYFKSPMTGKARDPCAYPPFSAGLRACPGQALAKLGIRVALPFLITNLDYDIQYVKKNILTTPPETEEEQLSVETPISFSNESQHHLEIDIKANKLHK